MRNKTTMGFEVINFRVSPDQRPQLRIALMKKGHSLQSFFAGVVAKELACADVPAESENDHYGTGYLEGQRAVWTRLLADALHNLGYRSPSPETWLIEREAVIALLREACRRFGDNDWHEQGFLGDILEGHLLEYLYAAKEGVCDDPC